MERVRLISTTISGMKNIKEPVTIDFSRTKDVSLIPSSGDNVRAIYGPNGSGKTGVAMALWTVVFLIRYSDYLGAANYSDLKKLINCETKALNVSIDFGVFQDVDETKLKLLSSYRYEISIVIRESGDLFISKEKLSRFNGKYKYSSLTSAFETSNGQIDRLWISDDSDIAQAIKKEALNTVGKQSFLPFLNQFLVNHPEYTDLIPIPDSLMYAAPLFLRKLRVTVQSAENPQNLIFAVSPAKGVNVFSMDPSQSSNLRRGRIDTSEILVHKSQLRSFETSLKRKAKFLRMFKPKLKGISYEKKDAGEFYLCTEILDYGTYTIGVDFESAGIKKLIRLFSYIDDAYQGAVAVIDELDAYLSGVYLEKLIRFLNDYGKGQLLFTAHSLEAMKALADHGKSIYFLSPSNKIYAWKKNAHYKPYVLYPEGMIGDIDFDLETFDFIEAFS